MLNRFEFGKPSGMPDVTQGTIPAIDGLLAEVREAIVDRKPLEPVIAGICRRLGFEQFVYATATVPLPNRDSRSLVWTTMPWEWVLEYERNAYIEVDPRVTQTVGRRAPLVWDAAEYVHDVRVASFFRAAARYGIGSGVIVPLSDPVYVRIGVGFNSPISPVGPQRRAQIESRLGDLMLFAAGFHDLFVANYLDTQARPGDAESTLSPRELECLALAARGMSSQEIGFKLGIAERTANFHFANVVGKLGVLNRKEAIAVAISKGLIRIAP